jgi:hypothetical protein
MKPGPIPIPLPFHGTSKHPSIPQEHSLRVRRDGRTRRGFFEDGVGTEWNRVAPPKFLQPSEFQTAISNHHLISLTGRQTLEILYFTPVIVHNVRQSRMSVADMDHSENVSAVAERIRSVIGLLSILIVRVAILLYHEI